MARMGSRPQEQMPPPHRVSSSLSVLRILHRSSLRSPRPVVSAVEGNLPAEVSALSAIIEGGLVDCRSGHAKADVRIETVSTDAWFPTSKSNLTHHKDIRSMNTSKSQRVWTLALSVALAAMGCTDSTQAPPAPTTTSTTASPSLPSGSLGATMVTATARVKAVDLQTRHVTLVRDDGSEVTIYADETVRNLPQVKVGDVVKASFYESLAYEVKKPGTATPGATVAEEAA